MGKFLAEKRDRVLLKELVKTDFKLRYQGSWLGYLWAVLRPMLLFLILYVVFARFLRFGDAVPFYPVYLLTGTVLWSFFMECTNQGISSLIIRGDLMRKLSFPKWIIPVSATVTALINLGINLCVVVGFAIFSGVAISWTWLLILPVIFELYLLSLGLAFLLGAINVRFRDIASIWEVISQALFYAVPVIYPVSMVVAVSERAARLLLLNPIAQVVQDVREFLVTDAAITTWETCGRWCFVPILLVVLIFGLGLWYFSRRAKYFAEEI